MSEQKPYNRIAQKPSDEYDLTGNFQNIPFIPINVKRDLSHCICNGKFNYPETIQCRSCGAKCHAECYKIKHDQHQFLTCISCQHKMVEAIMTQIEKPLDTIQKEINDITDSFDKLCDECQSLAPLTFESVVNVENTQILHSSLSSLLGEASFRWSQAVTQMKKIQNLVSPDLFFEQIPKPPHENGD